MHFTKPLFAIFLYSRFASIVFTAFVVSFFSVKNAYACAFSPPEINVPHIELIKRTNNIVLAQLISAHITNDNKVQYMFKTNEVIKGSENNQFSMEFYATELHKKYINHPELLKKSEFDKKNYFNTHKSILFWEKKQTRNNFGYCSVNPIFSAGEHEYLIFVDKPYHIRSFERIDSRHDKWLERVRNLVNNTNPNLKRPLSVVEYLLGFESIYMSKCPSTAEHSKNVKSNSKKAWNITHIKIFGLEKKMPDDYPALWFSWPCKINEWPVLLFYYDNKHYSPRTINIIDGMVDFTKWYSSEIELIGQLVYSIEELIDKLKTKEI